MYNKADLGNLMRQAQKMKDDMQKAREELDKVEITGESGAGLVKVTMTCKHIVKKIFIDDSLLAEKEDKEMLEDLIIAAMNDVLIKIEEATQEKMKSFTGGMGLPAGLDNIFK